MRVFGIKLIGFNAENGHKLLLTLIFVGAIYGIQRLVRPAMNRLSIRKERAAFWAKQGVSLSASALIVLVVLSIWFDDPARLTTGLGLFSAGLAFALQKVVTSFAGYIVIMRGKTFNVGERISMGGVRGDVIALGFIQTTIMEMGQPPAVQSADPAMWVGSRQFTGRIVTVTNDKIFEEPVYNYTREFPFIWEEIKIPIKYEANHELAERILLDSVSRHTDETKSLSKTQLETLERKYYLTIEDMVPKVFYRLTDNWLELTVRFIVKEHGIRFVKDAISRTILTHFRQAGIEVASATYELVGLPELHLKMLERTGDRRIA